MAAVDDFDEVLGQYHLALDEIMKGSANGYKKLYSRRDDATLANPFGPPVRGWDEVAKTLERAASHYRDGETTGFENVAKYMTPELAYTDASMFVKVPKSGACLGTVKLGSGRPRGRCIA